jgi:hypothetical protein
MVIICAKVFKIFRKVKKLWTTHNIDPGAFKSYGGDIKCRLFINLTFKCDLDLGVKQLN